MFGIEDSRILHEDSARNLRVIARDVYSDAFVAHLEDTTFGTAGLRYRRLGVREQLDRVQDGVFIELEQGGSLVGTYVLVGSRLHGAGADTTGLYRGLLSIRPDMRGKGLGRLLVTGTFDWLASLSRDSAQALVSWGCIERANTHSLRLLGSLGATAVGSLESLTAYVQWPRNRLAVDELDDSAAAEITDAVQRTLDDCGLRMASTPRGRYFAVTSGNSIVAGARATLTRVDMATTGSAWDSLYRYLLRFVPAARRRFDPSNFTYLRLTDIVIREGEERLWKDFLATILARHDAHMAMFVLDARSTARARLDRAGLFGRLTASTRQEVVVLANAWNLPAKSLDKASTKPLGIGPLDI
jgi:GNAT superfamily N-acetyltransferase